MNMKTHRLLTTVLLALLAIVPAAALPSALDRYIAKPDPTYRYTVYHRAQTLAYTTYFVDMVSQQWRSEAEVDRPFWQHEVQITVPALLHSASPRTALLVVNGGSNGGPLTKETGDLPATLAALSGSIVVMVNQIPNQPLSFADEGGELRTEDAIIAYTLDKFLDTGDPEWPVHLAMTKAVVRAMDTAQAVLADQRVGLDDFIVIGGSKRGWTAWLTGAVDPRVKGIVPISIDILNMEMQFIHHWEAYGFYSAAIQDYVDFDLPCRLLSDRAQELLETIDPWAYRERYTMPRLIINSAGDEFFVSDSSRFYFRDLPGPKSLRYTFNTDHAQGESEQELLDVVIGALLWVRDVNTRPAAAPRFLWTFEPDGSIRVATRERPDEVHLVQATNPFARDFRLESIGAAWTRSRLNDLGGGVYIGRAAPPSAGYTAFAVELVYSALVSGLPVRQVFTTDVRITPDNLPAQGSACPSAPAGMTNIAGTVSLGATPVCAVVLANGRHVFSCGPSEGRFQMAVPLQPNGEVTLFAFADGLGPYTRNFAPTGSPLDLAMRYPAAGDAPLWMPVDSITTTDRPDWVTIAGSVTTLDGTPACAFVLANGQSQFSCDESFGRYELTVPLDARGNVSVFGFADGFLPSREEVAAPFD